MSKKIIKKTKNIVLRVPEKIHEDLHKISDMSGISVNAICIELLRPSIKEKLKEFKE